MDLKHFITFLFKDGEKITQEVTTNDVSTIKVPEGAYGFITFDTTTDAMYVGKNKVADKGDIINEKTYYIGKVVSLEDIEKQFGKDSLELKDLVENQCFGAVLTPDNFLAPIHLNETINILAPEDVNVVLLEKQNYEYEYEPENE